MSMEILTVIQAVSAFCAYSFVTIAVPALIFGRRLSGRRLAERLLFYYLTGNFYVMNLVFFLQLLHISNRATLIAGSVFPAYCAWVYLNKIPVRAHLKNFYTNFRRFFMGIYGMKNGLLKLRLWVCGNLASWMKKLWRDVYRNIFVWIMIGLLMAAAIWVYGHQIVTYFGYALSDLPVHTYWINYLSRGEIFVAGVYPFGFHCEIYYLHTIFQIDTYVLLRVFSVSQVFYIFLMLAAFLTLSCKTKYLGCAGAIFAICFQGFRYNCYFRYAATLPQEFGMLFILPGIYFLFQFFEERKKEIADGKKTWRERRKSWYCLAAFGMGFSMTLAVHFYDTMIAGIFCVGVAVGFAFWIFRKKYFWSVLAAGLISVLAAVLPMGIAYASGTPLQGSLGWGMNVISGKTDEDESEAAESTEGTEAAEETGGTEFVAGTETIAETESTEEPSPGAAEPTESAPLFERIRDKGEKAYEVISGYIRNTIFIEEYRWLTDWVFLAIAALAGMGALFWMLRQGFYGSRLVASAAYMFLMCVLLASKGLGLPALMDSSRASIYFSYSLVIVPVLLLDGICFLIRLLVRRRPIMQLLSLACSTAVLLGGALGGMIKEPAYISPLQTNSAVTCLTNIIREDKDFTWTILSASDERNTALDHGYHYEMITFLRQLEYYNHFTSVTLPTQTVYIFIEKKPVAIGGCTKAGKQIGLEDAEQPLSFSAGVAAYQSDVRWTTMARMYYWAQAFQKMYPQEMQVYYETDEFVCYELKQNTYRLFNLAIDYGYNSIQW